MHYLPESFVRPSLSPPGHNEFPSSTALRLGTAVATESFVRSSLSPLCFCILIMYRKRIGYRNSQRIIFLNYLLGLVFPLWSYPIFITYRNRIGYRSSHCIICLNHLLGLVFPPWSHRISITYRNRIGYRSINWIICLNHF